jgi:two-component system, OmpR family, sensor histidine kinase KdpD
MRRRDVAVLGASIAALCVVTGGYFRYLHVDTASIAALSFLLIVLLAASTARLWVPVTVSVAALLLFNYFFLDPVGSLYLADPGEWVALAAFLTVSLVASKLSAAARARASEALARQRELACLFDVSRDVLSITDTAQAMRQLAECINRRFGLEFVALCLANSDTWDIVTAGSRPMRLIPSDLGAPNDPQSRTILIDSCTVHLVPLRSDATMQGLLAVAGRPVEPAMLDALAGVAAIAIERGRFLEARTAADIARRGEELKSALLASLGHDLRTPLTAIRIAAGNLRTSPSIDADQTEQTDLIVAEVARLNRHFDNILDMARIETGVIALTAQWVHPTDIFEAARDQAQPALRRHRVDVRAETDVLIRLDARLIASALARVLENAAQYSPAGSPIVVGLDLSFSDLTITVRDHGRGIVPDELPRLFDRFFRGAESGRRAGGSGIGLSIARGLVEAVHGRIHADNCPDGGARFTIVVPAMRKDAMSIESRS